VRVMPRSKAHFEGLLELQPKLGNFLEAPVLGNITAAGTPLRAGRFELGEELARGGMGIVYRARDDSLGREVAVKVLHERYLVDSLLSDRFLNEARITAQLQHPAIPPVFAVGRLADDRPYLAMKLIKGRTLDELLQERSSPAAERGRFLSVFQQVCQAVGYAHSRRVLHRDLKTANVMVGTFGEVQVMDWGLAKVLEPGGRFAPDPAASTETAYRTVIHTTPERDSATETGSMLGTPAFMSPEQAGGELDRLDERTDVFGLGAILCVILTGHPPYVGKSADQIPLMAIRGKLGDAYTRLDECGADARLVELCRQCLAVDQDNRPRDAAALASALAEYMTGVEERARRAEVELAAAETKAAELRKRRRVQLALAATLLVLVGSISIGLWSQERASNTARQRAEVDARLIREQKEIAEANEKTATQREAETRAVLDFVEKRVFATARPEKQKGGLGYKVTLRQAMEAALPFVAQSFHDQPLIEARLRMTIGISFRYLGDAKIAGDQFEAARRIYTKHLGADHPDTLSSMNNLANSYDDLGRHAEALNLREETLSLRRAKLGADHPHTLMSMNNLANSYAGLGRHAEALKLYEEALGLRKAKLGADHPDTLESMHNLANSYAGLGRHAEALKLREETLALLKAKLGADHPDTLASMNNLATSYAALGRLTEALRVQEETLALQTAKLGAGHAETLGSKYNVACFQALLVPKSADRGKQADLAMEALKQAVAAGFKDTAQIKADTDLDALRGREDFKKLLAELEAKQEKGKK
jgi:eukaryotic-like serine/threonine-protein kinase